MASEIHMTPALSDALVILGAAGIVIPAFARFRISPVIGFILVGILVGPFGLGALTGQYPWLHDVTITDPEGIEPFAEFGIILLLFSIGLELCFRRLWRCATLVFGVGAAELVGTAPADRRRPVLVDWATAGAALWLAWRWPCPRPRWSCRWPAPTARSAAPPSRCCCSRIWRWCR